MLIFNKVKLQESSISMVPFTATQLVPLGFRLGAEFFPKKYNAEMFYNCIRMFCYMFRHSCRVICNVTLKRYATFHNM